MVSRVTAMSVDAITKMYQNDDMHFFPASRQPPTIVIPDISHLLILPKYQCLLPLNKFMQDFWRQNHTLPNQRYYGKHENLIIMSRRLESAIASLTTTMITAIHVDNINIDTITLEPAIVTKNINRVMDSIYMTTIFYDDRDPNCDDHDLIYPVVAELKHAHHDTLAPLSHFNTVHFMQLVNDAKHDMMNMHMICNFLDNFLRDSDTCLHTAGCYHMYRFHDMHKYLSVSTLEHLENVRANLAHLVSIYRINLALCSIAHHTDPNATPLFLHSNYSQAPSSITSDLDSKMCELSFIHDDPKIAIADITFCDARKSVLDKLIVDFCNNVTEQFIDKSTMYRTLSQATY